MFVLTGFWHGASWNFLLWGLFHGLFITLEHAGFKNTLRQLWPPIQHLYLLAIVLVGWVFFRSNTAGDAFGYLSSMVDLSNTDTSPFQYAQILSHEAAIALIVGIILSTPAYPYVKHYLTRTASNNTMLVAVLLDLPRVTLLSSLLFLSALKLASSTYNPFIYFRF